MRLSEWSQDVRGAWAGDNCSAGAPPGAAAPHMARPGRRSDGHRGCQWAAHRGDVDSARRAPRPWQPVRTIDGARPDHGAPRHLCRAHPDRPDVTQPVAGPALRHGPAHRVAPMAGLLVHVAPGRAHSAHHRWLVAGRWQHGRGRDVEPHHGLPICPHGMGQPGPVRPRRDHVRPRCPQSTDLRDVALHPSLCVPGHCPGIPSPGGRGDGFHVRPRRGTGPRST